MQEYFRRQNKANKIRGYLVLSIFVFIGLIILLVNLNKSTYKSPNETLQNSEDQLSGFLAQFGQPDKIVSTEYDSPRPPIVTQQLYYKRQKLVATFYANAEIGAPPPYAVWKLMGFKDLRTNKVITAEVALTRLKK